MLLVQVALCQEIWLIQQRKFAKLGSQIKTSGSKSVILFVIHDNLSLIKDFMDSLLAHFDGDDDVKDALGNISDETIEKVFAGKVGVFAHTVEQAF